MIDERPKKWSPRLQKTGKNLHGQSWDDIFNPPKKKRKVKLFRVVDTDNFGGDYPNEKFVSEPMSKAKAEKLAATHNGGRGCSPRFWMVQPEGYKLQPGFEP